MKSNTIIKNTVKSIELNIVLENEEDVTFFRNILEYTRRKPMDVLLKPELTENQLTFIRTIYEELIK